MKKVLRIYGKKSISQHQKSFDEEAKKNGNIKIDFMCYLDFYYDGAFREISSGKKIKEYDIYRISGSKKYASHMITGLNYYFGHLKNKKLIDNINYYITDTSKFQQLLFLDYYNFSTPKTLFFHITKEHMHEYKDIIKKSLTFPFLAKDLYKHRGKGIFLIENDKQLQDKIQEYENAGILFQEYIKNTGEFRVITIGNEIAGAFKRYNPHHYKNNIPKGAIFENIRISKGLEKTILDIVKKYQLDFAGIDIIASDKKYHILEINTVPQFQRMEKVTNINIVGKLVDHLTNIKKS